MDGSEHKGVHRIGCGNGGGHRADGFVTGGLTVGVR